MTSVKEYLGINRSNKTLLRLLKERIEEKQAIKFDLTAEILYMVFEDEITQRECTQVSMYLYEKGIKDMGTSFTNDRFYEAITWLELQMELLDAQSFDLGKIFNT